MFCHVFIKFWKLKSFHLEKQNSIAIKCMVFSLHKSFLILWGKNYFQSFILSFWLMSSDWNSLNYSIELKKQPSNKILQNSFLKKIRRIHMETNQIYNSNKKRLQWWCIPVNLAKFLRTFCYRTPQASASGFFYSPN